MSQYNSFNLNQKQGTLQTHECSPRYFVSELFAYFSGPFGGPFFYKLCKFIKSYILSKSPLNALASAFNALRHFAGEYLKKGCKLRYLISLLLPILHQFPIKKCRRHFFYIIVTINQPLMQNGVQIGYDHISPCIPFPNVLYSCPLKSP